MLVDSPKKTKFFLCRRQNNFSLQLLSWSFHLDDLTLKSPGLTINPYGVSIITPIESGILWVTPKNLTDNIPIFIRSFSSTIL